MVLAGDSIVQAYPLNHPRRGWGQFLADHFDSGVKIVNLAKSGRSTKTFRAEGLWAKLLAEKPDIVLIQFGHNDARAKEGTGATDRTTGFKDNREEDSKSFTVNKPNKRTSPGTEDRTHCTEKGARELAKMVVKRLCEVNDRLKAHLRPSTPEQL